MPCSINSTKSLSGWDDSSSSQAEATSLEHTSEDMTRCETSFCGQCEYKSSRSFMQRYLPSSTRPLVYASNEGPTKVEVGPTSLHTHLGGGSDLPPTAPSFSNLYKDRVIYSTFLFLCFKFIYKLMIDALQIKALREQLA